MCSAIRWLVAAVTLGLVACGGGGYGGGGNGGGSSPPALAVTNTTPAGGATGVARKGSIVLTFSKALDASSIGANTVSLAASNSPPFTTNAFSVVTAGNTITITPGRPLMPLAAYQVNVSAVLRGMGGEILAAPLVLNFTTADRQWQTATRLEPTAPATAESPRVVVDGQGNAIAVWQRRDGITRSIWSNRFVLGTGWGNAAQISTLAGPQTNADTPEIAVDASGNAIVVWEQNDDAVVNAWSNYYTAGIGWGTAARIPTTARATDDSFAPHVALDAAGNALAVWQQYDGGIFDLWSNRFSGGTWGTAVQVETNPGNAIDARIAFDSTGGRAFAVWLQGTATCLCVWANQYSAANSWGTPKMIASGSALTSTAPQITVDGAGNAHAVWTESEDGQHFDVWSNRFAAGGEWGMPVRIDDHTGGSGLPKIVIDANANVYAVWEQTQPNSGAIIHWNLYKNGIGWGTPGLIAPATDVPSGTGGNPDIALDPNGIAHVVWEHDDGVQIHVKSSRLTPPSTEWTAPLDAHSTDSVAGPQIAVDPSGDVTAVWEQRDGAGVAVWSNRFE